MENFYKKYDEYKKKELFSIEINEINEINKINKIKVEKLKEEIYNIIYESVKHLDITKLIITARQDAIDYNMLNDYELYNKISKYNNKMTEINNEIIIIQQKPIINKDNIMKLSNKYINFISYYKNKTNIKKFRKLFDNNDNYDNYYLIKKINNIDITKIENNTEINNGYTIEMIEMIKNNKINRIYFLLINHITDVQKNNKINLLIDEYLYNFTNYNIIKNKIKKLNQNFDIAYQEIKNIIIKNIIIISKYLLIDEIITETFLQNEKYFFEIQCKLYNKNNIYNLIKDYNIQRLNILKKYLLNNLIL